VVIGTTRDPATPYQWAVSLAEQLESGVLIKRDGDGHTGFNAGNDCVDDAVNKFLVRGVVPPDGLSC
ncbi:MAG TPA: alpha/beta hydrolase, partial [Marmoricola sp.]|nr:alpha/beta hydrolase [Marmoricola sp.]